YRSPTSHRRTRGHELRPFFFFAPSRVYLFGAQRRSGVHLCGGGPAAAGSIPRRMCRGDRRHAAVRGLSSPAAGENDRPAATPVHPGAGAPAGRARVSSHGTIAGTAPTINAALHSLGLAPSPALLQPSTLHCTHLALPVTR